MPFFGAIAGVIKGIGSALLGVVSVGGGFLEEFFGRFFGLPGLFLDLIGIRPKKKLRLRFLILANQFGPLVPPANLQETFKLTKRIYDEQADIKVIQSDTSIAYGAPEGALEVTTPIMNNIGHFGEVGAYFHGLSGLGFFTRRLSVIIVNTIDGNQGRAYWAAGNFVIIEKRFFDDPKDTTTLVAHEIGHACGLILHRDKKENLMYRNHKRGEKLDRWQSSIVRGSKFVWYI